MCSLLYCETVAALGVLETGGAFVLKMFTWFRRDTLALLRLLGSLFASLHVAKPDSSRQVG